MQTLSREQFVRMANGAPGAAETTLARAELRALLKTYFGDEHDFTLPRKKRFTLDQAYQVIRDAVNGQKVDLPRTPVRFNAKPVTGTFDMTKLEYK